MGYPVYSFGMVAPSVLHVLKDAFPDKDAYAEMRESFVNIGGEAANSSIVLARLGVKTKLDGNRLGKNQKGKDTLKILKGFGINVSRIKLEKGYEGVSEMVISDHHTRTNFGSYCKLLFEDKKWNRPVLEDIAQAEIVCLDPFFEEASEEAARYSFELGKPYVTVDVPPESSIAKNAAAVIIAGEFRKARMKDVPVEELFESYRKECRGWVIFTFGDQEVRYARKTGEIFHFKPYSIEAVDTAGAGDSFRSGIIYGMLKEWPMDQTVRFASAVAAMVCMSFPGVLKSPSLKEVEEFIWTNNPEEKRSEVETNPQ